MTLIVKRRRKRREPEQPNAILGPAAARAITSPWLRWAAPELAWAVEYSREISDQGLTALYNPGLLDDMSTTFRTESGSRYIYAAGILTRLSERPVVGLDPRPQEAELVVPIEVGHRAVFTIDGEVLRTSPVVDVS